MVSQVYLGLHDFDTEQSSMTINVEDVTAVNIAATVTAIGDLRAATNALTLADIDSAKLTVVEWSTLSVVTNPFAQRETKWQVIVAGLDGKKYASTEIPTADLSILGTSKQKYLFKDGAVVMTAAATEINAYITAYEALALDKNGDAITVTDIYQVGRNI